MMDIAFGTLVSKFIDVALRKICIIFYLCPFVAVLVMLKFLKKNMKSSSKHKSFFL